MLRDRRNFAAFCLKPLCYIRASSLKTSLVVGSHPFPFLLCAFASWRELLYRRHHIIRCRISNLPQHRWCRMKRRFQRRRKWRVSANPQLSAIDSSVSRESRSNDPANSSLSRCWYCNGVRPVVVLKARTRLRELMLASFARRGNRTGSAKCDPNHG
jgi:hypothetical protein